LIAAGLRAQNSTPADSAQIRLNEAHDLYTHGLITAEEYATIRAQYAGVKRDTQPQPKTRPGIAYSVVTTRVVLKPATPLNN